MTSGSTSVEVRVLGHAAFDKDHAEFADLIARLASAGADDLAGALSKLHSHARRHFGAEDSELRALGGSANDCHFDEHQAVLASMQEVAVLLGAGKCDVVWRLARELADWLPGHVEEMDMRLAQALFQQRTGGAQIQLPKPGQRAGLA